MNQLVSNLLALPVAVQIVAILVMVNLGISALTAALEKIKDKTSTDLDNKAYAILHVAADVLQKVLDFVSANRPHPTEAAAPAAEAVKAPVSQ